MRHAIILLSLFVWSCGGSGNTPGAPAIAQITIAPAQTSVERGATVQLTATALDASGKVVADAPFTWASDANSVATVSAGRVTAVAVGSASITATSGTKSGTASVAVTVPAVASVQISGSAPPPFIFLGQTLQLQASAVDARGAAIPEATIAWSSSDASVAAVAASGLVSAIGDGQATLTAASGSESATIAVSVAQQVAQVSLGASSQSVQRGATLQLNASVVDSGATPIAGALVGWSSDQASVASVDANGLVSAVAVGTANVTATSGSMSASVAVTVVLPPVASVQITESAPSPLTFLGASFQLHAQALDMNSAPISGAIISWTSDTASVATVDENGLVSAVGDGTANISASSGGQSAQLAITVSQTVAAVAISIPSPGNAQLTAFGATLQLSAQATDSGGHPLGGVAFAWTSSDSSIASVDAESGLVTAQRNGSAVITAAASGQSGTTTVSVQQLANTTSVLPPSASIERGATQTFTAAASDANGNPVGGLTPSWSVDSGGIASIDGNGIASGLVVGSTQVHAAMGGHSGNASLAVVVPGVAAVTIAQSTPAPLDHLGQTLQLSASATDARGNAIPEAQIAWSSGTPGVASVDPQSGLVTALANGQSVITASAGTKSSTLTIAVSQTVQTVSVAAHANGSTMLGAVGSTLQLDATARDSGGAPVANSTFAWVICDGAVIANGCTNNFASISSGGVVTALANGSAIAQASSGGQSGTIGLQVSQAIAQVSVTPSSDTIGYGDTRQFTAGAFDANSHPVANAPAATWASSATSIATVDSTGLATATSAALSSPQSTQITATFTDSNGAHSGSATLTVDPAIHAAASVQLTASVGAGPFTALGQTQSLSAQAFDSSNTPIANLSYAWSSSDSTVVQVVPQAAGSASATMTVIGDGSATITASAGGKDATLAVTVAQQVASVSAAGQTTLASLGATVQLTALDANAQPIAAGVTWISCDGSGASCTSHTVADVSVNGLVTARNNGGAQISAQTTLSQTTSTASLNVAVAQQVASVSAQSSTTLISFNATVQLTALDANNQPVDSAGLTWTSTDSSIASVNSSGLATALANGSVTIKAKGQFDNGQTIGVTVSQAVASVVTTVPGAATTLTSFNATLQLTALDALGSTVPDATFTSCDGANSPPCNLATIAPTTAAGLATAKATGAARVTARRGSEAGGAIALLVSQQAASVSPPSATLISLLQTQQLVASDSGGSPIATGVTWTACDNLGAPPSCGASTIASVDNNGLATALLNGQSRITASTVLGSGTTQAHSDLTIAQSVAAVTTSAQGASTTLASFQQTLQLEALDPAGHALAAARTLTWSSDASGVASVDLNGLVTAIADGSARITATGLDNTSAMLEITVAQLVAQVSASDASTTLQSFGATLQLEALDARGNTVGGVSWLSANGSAASVSDTGMVTALANGTSSISAFTSGSAGAQLSVLVAQQPSSASPTGPITLTSLSTGAGSTVQLGALDANSNPISSGVTWIVCANGLPTPCGTTTVIKVGSTTGLVTALKNGSAFVNIVGSLDSISVGIAVQQAVSTVSVTPASTSVGAGATTQFTATAKDAGGSIISGTSATWQSSDASIASINSATGLATGVAIGGPVTITGTISGISNTAQLTVAALLYALTINNYDSWCNATATVGSTVVANITTQASQGISPQQPAGTTISLTSTPHGGFAPGSWLIGGTVISSPNTTYMMTSAAGQSITVCCPFSTGGGCPPPF